jgi:hypothetical protein
VIRLEDLPNPLPRQWEMELFLTLVAGDEILDTHLSIYEQDKSHYRSGAYQVLAKALVTFEVFDINIPGIQIESLKKQKQQILAEAHVKAEQIEQQIQSLLAIEYQPETDGAA